VSTSVGLIGCGKMGYGLGRSLLRKNYKLYIFPHHNMTKINLLKNQGAIVCESIRMMTSECKVILMSLPNVETIQEIIFGKNGLANFENKQNIIIDTSTSSYLATKEICRELDGIKVKYIDAPLIGNPIEAEMGKLTTIVGTEQGASKTVDQIIKSFSKNVIYVGKSGEGQKLKLLCNFVCMSFALIVEFALSCGKQINVDLQQFDRAMSCGTNYVATIPMMLTWLRTKDTNILDFSIKNAAKDLHYFYDMINNLKNKNEFVSILKLYESVSINEKFKNKTLPFLFVYFQNFEK